MNMLGTVCVLDAIFLGGFTPFVGDQNSSEPLVEKEAAQLSGDNVSGMTNTSAVTQKFTDQSERQFRAKKTVWHRINARNATIQELAVPEPKKKDVTLRFWKLGMKKRQPQQNNSK